MFAAFGNILIIAGAMVAFPVALVRGVFIMPSNHAAVRPELRRPTDGRRVVEEAAMV